MLNVGPMGGLPNLLEPPTLLSGNLMGGSMRGYMTSLISPISE